MDGRHHKAWMLESLPESRKKERMKDDMAVHSKYLKCCTTLIMSSTNFSLLKSKIMIFGREFTIVKFPKISILYLRKLS